MKEKTKVLITGSAGFVGRHLFNYLKTSQVDVAGIDVKRTNSTNFVCDVTVLEDVKSVFESFQPDVVVHLAALCNSKESNEKPYPYFHTNSFGTLNVIDCCVNYNARVIFMSSAAVLGSSSKFLPISEDNWQYNPQSGYAYSKVLSEYMIFHYMAKKGLKATIFRCWDLIGEGLRGTILNLLAAKVKKEEPITLYCYGEQVMDFNYVGNLCEAIRSVLMNPSSTFGELFHIGSGQPVKLKWVVEKLIQISGSKSKIKLAPPRPNEIPVNSYPSITKAEKYFNYRPSVNIEEALRRSLF
ncbi:NAD-dependent epimerase/dehydratase family protein [Candidatus Hecatella orcuttiae]|uniref:NAD-dependent epimerase/dehydratase family protein n=1 Tax=Candidatus Hecatella orcuttiae TaxID=1935119 RepID=UPI002868248F|nr:NAD-dependent epimerase/dehydratase family protein [Candidatus Hecatella orcuttiae]